MTEKTKKSSAHLQVLLMFAILIATMALGFYMMPHSQDEHDRLLAELGTTNHGTLLTPVKAVAELDLREDGNPWVWSEHKPKWRVLIPAAQGCNEECEQLLYTTRQMHIRLGKYTGRLERMLLVTDDLSAAFTQRLQTEYPYLEIVRADAEQLRHWLSATNRPWQPERGTAILADPEGVAMMVYDVNHGGNDMLEDINHLLKYSAD